MRSNRIHESLSLVLYDWIPEKVRSEWLFVSPSNQFQVNPNFENSAVNHNLVIFRIIPDKKLTTGENTYIVHCFNILI